MASIETVRVADSAWVEVRSTGAGEPRWAATQAHVLETSYSSAVALELAATALELVRTLTLVEPSPRHGASADKFAATHSRQVSELLADFLDRHPM